MAAAVRPSGPKGQLFWGHLADYKRDTLGFVTRCAREYGDVVPIRLGHKPVLLLNHPDQIEYVLVTNNRNFSKDFSLRLYRPIIGNGLLTSEGDFWLRQRRLVQPVFSRQRIAAYSGIMVASTERMLARWRDGQTFDLHQQMMHLTLEIAAKTLFDTEVTAEAYEVSTALELALRSIDARFGALFWVPDWVPIPNNMRLHRAVGRLDAILYAIINARRQSGEDRGDLLSLLLHARDEDDGSRMTDKQLRDEAMTLFLAGHETTALALSWTWYLLGQHPAVVRKLEEELRTMLGGRPPTFADLQQLRYTERVILESLRLYPPAYAIAREARDDCEIGGYPVPAGTTLFLFQWVVQRDPRFYENAEQFDPDRWADGLAQRLPKYAYFPFGGGPRQCIGNTFALMEAVLVLATMAQKFRITLVPDHNVRIWPAITLRPRNGIQVLVNQR
jgi:cytochrome P450